MDMYLLPRLCSLGKFYQGAKFLVFVLRWSGSCRFTTWVQLQSCKVSWLPQNVCGSVQCCANYPSHASIHPLSVTALSLLCFFFFFASVNTRCLCVRGRPWRSCQLIAGPSLMVEASKQGANRTSGEIWGLVSCSRILWHATQLSPVGIWTSDIPVTSWPALSLSYSHPTPILPTPYYQHCCSDPIPIFKFTLWCFHLNTISLTLTPTHHDIMPSRAPFHNFNPHN